MSSSTTGGAEADEMLDVARRFVEACEKGSGWDVVKEFCIPRCKFRCRCAVEPVCSFLRVAPYAKFMQDLCTQYLAADWTVKIVHAAIDARTGSACIRGTASGRSSSGVGPNGVGQQHQEGGATPPETTTNFTYLIDFDDDGKCCKAQKMQDVEGMVEQLGWLVATSGAGVETGGGGGGVLTVVDQQGKGASKVPDETNFAGGATTPKTTTLS